MSVSFKKFFRAIYKQKNKLFFVLFGFVLIGTLIPARAKAILPIVAGAYALYKGSNVVEAIIAGINSIIGIFLFIPLAVSGTFTLIVESLLGWILSSNIVYLTSPAVTLGWPIVRDFANMVVVLALIVIALATILRYRDYEAKKLLPSLIIAALLINFSLVICGVFIDGSNLVTNSLLRGASGTIGKTVGQKVSESTDGFFDRATISKKGVAEFVVDTLSRTFYNTMSGIVLLLYLFLFLFRIIALWILLILSPLAFACYVLPNTKRFFDMWWNNFVQWCIIGIIGAFFYMIAGKLMDGLNNVPPQTVWASGRVTGSLLDLFKFVIPGAFLVAGFLFSLQTSAMGSGAAISAFRKTAGAIRTGAKATGKFVADNSGITRAKNAVVDRATQLGENLRLVNRGTADANRKARQTGELDEKGRVDRANNMTAQQKLAEARRSPITREAGLNQAAVLKSMSKEEFAMLSNDEQRKLVENGEQYGLKSHEMVGKMSTFNQNEVIRNNQFNPKTREEAAKALAAKGQLDSSLPGAGRRGGALTQDEIIKVMEDARANGSDLKDIIGGLQGADLAQILEDHQDAVAVARSAGIPTGPSEILDGPTRAKLLKALADKKQTDLLEQSQLIDAMNEAAINGMKPQDIVGKLNSRNQAHIIENNLFNPETRGKAVEALMKKKELNLIPEPIRATAYREAVESGGVDPEDLENSDYRAGAFNRARIDRLEAANPGLARTAYEQMARNQVLDENIGNMNGEQLRDIDVGDLFGPAGSLQYRRVARLAPEKIRQFQSAPAGHRAILKTHIPTLDADILTEREEAINATRGFDPGTTAATRPGLAVNALLINIPQAAIHTNEASRLERVRNSINNLP